MKRNYPPSHPGDDLYYEQFGETPRVRAGSAFYGNSGAQPRGRQEPRSKNYSEWDQDQDTIWRAKPIEEVESYYINLRRYLTNLKFEANQTGDRPVALIKKKKKWLHGLEAILMEDPLVSSHYLKQHEERQKNRKKKQKTGKQDGLTVEMMQKSKSEELSSGQSVYDADASSSVRTSGAADKATPIGTEAREALRKQRQRRSSVATDCKDVPPPGQEKPDTIHLECEEDLLWEESEKQ